MDKSCRRLVQDNPPKVCGEVALWQPMITFQTTKGPLQIAFKIPFCYGCHEKTVITDFTNEAQRKCLDSMAVQMKTAEITDYNGKIQWLPLNGIAWPD